MGGDVRLILVSEPVRQSGEQADRISIVRRVIVLVGVHGEVIVLEDRVPAGPPAAVVGAHDRRADMLRPVYAKIGDGERHPFRISVAGPPSCDGFDEPVRILSFDGRVDEHETAGAPTADQEPPVGRIVGDEQIRIMQIVENAADRFLQPIQSVPAGEARIQTAERVRVGRDQVGSRRSRRFFRRSCRQPWLAVL
ncbi:hypothetical protein [Bifidobacterium sp. SO1]|uniref:hypothetical protein n=1 Tax=Bifidobacterium sp. SO1 TaxID=2809029 RepID=UPI001BDD3D88|nr:hypothetical protein [Bifidobacterium sp. SO1]MBT1162743.1 hypothetical protein [Bifidobacterium sp. SO1]